VGAQTEKQSQTRLGEPKGEAKVGLGRETHSAFESRNAFELWALSELRAKLNKHEQRKATLFTARWKTVSCRLCVETVTGAVQQFGPKLS